MRKGRDLTGTERKLWNSVARTVAPLPERKIPGLPETKEPDLALPAPNPIRGETKVAPIMPRRSPLQPADPQREKLVARGRLAIDAVLDLHGLRQAEADKRTTAFITRAALLEHRVLLVITGKGSKEGEQGRGVLKKRFLQGIEMGQFGGAVSSVRQAHQRHGGAGAFYVFLRAPKKR